MVDHERTVMDFFLLSRTSRTNSLRSGSRNVFRPVLTMVVRLVSKGLFGPTMIYQSAIKKSAACESQEIVGESPSGGTRIVAQKATG